MTPAQWRQHGLACRTVAAGLEDETARRVLLEAAEDYLAIAELAASAERRHPSVNRQAHVSMLPHPDRASRTG